jgi:predicted esterase
MGGTATYMKAMIALNRRDFLKSAAATSIVSLAGCKFLGITDPGGSANLTAGPHAPTNQLQPGTFPLDFGEARKGWLVVPASMNPKTPMPLLLALHGAGIGSNGPLNFLRPYAEEFGFFLLAPDSRGITWDAIRGDFGPDVRFISQALEFAFDSCLVDANRIYIEGFSDGASYALGLGPANPELFSRVIAFSAGFITKESHPVNGVPKIFISHGEVDPVLPYQNAVSSIVPSLRSAGFSVEFVPFYGEHEVPPSIARAAIQWMLSPLTPRP